MLSREDVERFFENHPFLRRPRLIYILEAPIISPELKAKILGLNPAFERSTAILSVEASEETLAHETLHTMFIGEVLAPRLARFLVEFRRAFPPVLVRRRARYREKVMDSEELKRYGLTPYELRNGYKPAKAECSVMVLDYLHFLS